MPWWEVLGIEEDATARGIKRAYAKLLKQHRPEEDPEGFKRIHDAYQEALARLKWAEQESEAMNAAGIMPMDGARFREEIFDRQIDPLDAEPLDAGPMPPRAAPQKPAAGPSLIMINQVNLEEVLDALEADEDAYPMRVLTAVYFKDQRNLKGQFAEALLKDKARFANEASARFACRLAGLVAFTDTHKSEALLNMVYENLAPDERDYALARPTWLVSVATVFKSSVNRRYWDFWCAAFSEPERIDWDSERAQAALREVDGLGYWRGYELVDQVVPPEHQRWNQRAAETGVSLEPRPTHIRYDSSHSIWEDIRPWIFPGIFLVIIFVRIASWNSMADRQNQPPPPLIPPPMTVAEDPNWTKTENTEEFFEMAETVETVETRYGPIKVASQRTVNDMRLYTAVHEGHARRFNAEEYRQWKQIEEMMFRLSEKYRNR